jgi:hypothetical protein
MREDRAAAKRGWSEPPLGLLCLTTLAVGAGIGLLLLRIDPVALGILLAALSAIGGLAGFLASFFVRIRP